MIEFRTLGRVDLRGSPPGPLLRQPKCLALLAYLAMARPHRFHRRDSLVGLFWPEMDERHARAALSQTLYRLRRALNADAIVVRGAEEVAVDPAHLWCDAAALEEAFEAGDFARAVELYQGEPLPGFILSDSADFELWLAGVRTRLRALAGRAARKRAEEAEAAGDDESAVSYARRALELSQDDEAELRELLALLARTGDRAGALRAYDDFAARLREDFGAEPDARTTAVVEELRRPPQASIQASAARGEGARSRSSEPLPDLPAPLPAPPAVPVEPAAIPAELAAIPVDPAAIPVDPATTSAEPTAAPSARRFAGSTLSRRRAALPLLVLGVAATGWLVLAPGRGTGDPTIASRPGQAVRIAVFPFAYEGSGASADIARGMASVLGANLDGAGDLRSVDHRALLNAMEDAGPEAPDRVLAREIGGRLGASLYVLGEVVETGDRLRMTATLYDASTGASLADAVANGTTGDIFGVIDRLSVRLIGGTSAARGDDLTRTAALTAGSLPALKAYLEGDAEYRAGRYREAVRALDRAVTLDSAFALAHYRLSGAAHWLASSDIAEKAVKAALRHQERLTEGERALVVAFDRYLAGDVIEAERLYRRALAVRPDDVEAWLNLAEVQFHWWSHFGRSALDSKAAFQHVLRYEPDHPGALVHLVRIAASEGDAAQVDSLAGRLARLDLDPGQRLEVDALRGIVARDQEAIERTLGALAAADDAVVENLVRSIAVHSHDLEVAARAARIQAAPERDPLVRGRAHVMLAQIELARGRWRAAEDELDLLEAIQPGWALQYRAAFAAFPFLPTPAPALRRLREALEGPAELQPARPEFPYAPRQIYPPRRHYLAGLLGLRSGDRYAALRHAVEMERSTGDGVRDAFGETYARGLRAALARSQGQPEEALRLLDAPRIPPDSIRPNIGSFPDADARFLKAELLREQGRVREAIRWYASFPDPAAYDLIYLAPSHLRRGQLQEELGDSGRARGHYARLLELWGHADESFRPWLEEARQGLARLEGS